MTATANHIRTAAANQIRTAAANHIRTAGVNHIRTAAANHIRTAGVNHIRAAGVNHIRTAGVTPIRINAEQRSTDRCDRSVQDSPRQGNRTAVKQNEILYRYLFFIIIPDPHYGRSP